MNFIEACRKFISLDTTPSQGSLAAALWLKEYAESRGLQAELQVESFADKEEANVIIRPVGLERQGADFLLQGHLDTVDPGHFHAWAKTNFDPFNATIEDGKIYGLGSAEVKLDLLCKVEALAHYGRQTKFKLDPVVVATFGEETGMQGALRLIRKNKVNPKMAVISEPSDMHVMIAAKGFAHVEIRIPFSNEEMQHRNAHDLHESTSTQSKIFKGKASHSSAPQWGESAISKLFAHLEQLPKSLTIMEVDGGTSFNSVPAQAFLEMDFFPNKESTVSERILKIYSQIRALQDELQKIQDQRFSPEFSTLNIGVIRTFKDHIYLAGTCRMLPSVTQEVYEKWMSFIKTACDEVGANFRIVDYKKPFSTKENSILVKASLDTLRSQGWEKPLITQPSTNEASLFSRLGVDCICFGPGKREENIHTANEHVVLDDLDRARQFYSQLIERICL